MKKKSSSTRTRAHRPFIRAAARTSVGKVRTNNEDTYGIDRRCGLYLVCDGMGGAAGGEVASLMACRTATASFAAQSIHSATANAIEENLNAAFTAANSAVWREGRGDEHHNMGTTMVAAAIAGDTLVIGNVGDSRAYLLQSQGWRQITTDHSYINELVRLGSIREEDVNAPELQRFGSIITRAIGAAEDITPDFFHLKLHDGDAVLLCSDGLTRYLDAPQFDNEIDLGDLDAACKHLCDLANKLGGIDNITCLLLRYHAE